MFNFRYCICVYLYITCVLQFRQFNQLKKNGARVNSKKDKSVLSFFINMTTIIATKTIAILRILSLIFGKSSSNVQK